MQHLIDKYELLPHPEGGYYKEVYRSQQTVTSAVINQQRQAVTHIYFLLTKSQVSRFHRVVHDEIWNFYEGAPLRLLSYDGTMVKETLLGQGCENYAQVVAGGHFQAAESTGDYSLVGCSVAPGFDFTDFSFLSDTPKHMEQIKRLDSTLERFF